MNKPMPIGIDDFKKVRENYYLVDKTDIIRRLIDTHAEITLFTRPRRFGKTLTMSMLDYFFSIDKKAYSESLFKDLDISKSGTDYMKERGKYPVIFMTLKDCAELNWSDTYEQFKIFIDEYDAPLQAAYSHGFYEEAIAFFRRWLSIALKGNGNLHFAVLTGVQRIAKESIFSGLPAIYGLAKPLTW